MFKTSSQQLGELASLLQDLHGTGLYTRPIRSLSQSTIGQHTRHIIELYQCLLNAYDSAVVNYDDRKRDKQLETDVTTAIREINRVNKELEQPDKSLQIRHSLAGIHSAISSTYYREIYYNLEHCIHHQALIKVALIELEMDTVPAAFGVAPSTLQYRQQCAQ
jgi:hypothetical protein